MILRVEAFDQVQGAVEEPLHDDERDGCADRVPGGVQFGAVDDVLGSQMARDEVGCGVIVDGLGESVRLLVLPSVCPLGEHGLVAGQQSR